MIPSRRLARTLPLLSATLGAALLLVPGCGDSDNPSRHAATIELPSRENTRVNGKDLARSKATRPPAKH